VIVCEFGLVRILAPVIVVTEARLISEGAVTVKVSVVSKPAVAVANGWILRL